MSLGLGSAGYFYNSAQTFMQTIKTDVDSFSFHFKQPVWEYLAGHPEVDRIFNQAMQEIFNIYAQYVLKNYDFLPYGKVVDVGSGLGSLSVCRR